MIPSYLYNGDFCNVKMLICISYAGECAAQRWILAKKGQECRSDVVFVASLNNLLTHWGRVTHICVGNLTIIGPDNGLSPGRRQAITWTYVEVLLIGPLGTNFSEMLIEIHTFSFKKIHFKMPSGKWRPFCLGLNELNKQPHCWFWGLYEAYPLILTSCGGTSKVTVRKSTFEYVSMHGSTKKIPAMNIYFVKGISQLQQEW